MLNFFAELFFNIGSSIFFFIFIGIFDFIVTTKILEHLANSVNSILKCNVICNIKLKISKNIKSLKMFMLKIVYGIKTRLNL